MTEEGNGNRKKRKDSSFLRKFIGPSLWIVLVVVVGGLITYALIPKPVAVDLGVVERGSLMVTVDDDGKTRVRERYVVAAPLSGIISRLSWEEGDTVGEGEVLVTMEPTPSVLVDPRSRAQSEASLRAAEAAVATAKARLESRKAEEIQLEKAFKRSRTLHDAGNIPDAEFEQAESAYLSATHGREGAESDVKIAEFDRKQAEAALQRFDKTDESTEGQFAIQSPVDGVVLRIAEKSSRLVQPGEELLEIGDPGDLEMLIDVLSQDAVRIAPGQRILIEHWGGEQPLEGRVRLVEPSGFTKVSALGVDEQRVNVVADFIELPEGTGETLGDGFRVEAKIVVWEMADGLKVPTGALFREGEDWTVYRVVGGKAKLTPVKIDHNNGEFARVVEGLGEGEDVILHPGDSVEEGIKVEPRKP